MFSFNSYISNSRYWKECLTLCKGRNLLQNTKKQHMKSLIIQLKRRIHVPKYLYFIFEHTQLFNNRISPMKIPLI